VTDSEELVADHVVVTAGAWTESLLPQLAPLRLSPQRKLIVWFEPRDNAACAESRMPAWLIDDLGASGNGVYYGIPTWDGQIGAAGVKVGFHGPGVPIDPGGAGEPDPALVKRFLADVASYLPVLGDVSATLNCTYTMTTDEHFVVDRLPDLPIAVACGFSGHGFKFAPVIGEVLADLAVGQVPADIEFLSLRRF
jgi:glycine/D-amino acid oxidase-like deaminating enzyme